MKRMLAAVALFLCLASPWLTHALAIDKLSAADATAIHEVVRAQLEALSNDDAAGAFALATHEKRMLIGSPDNFLRLIKEEYNPIYRYRRVIFSPPNVIDGDAIQVVRVTDSSDHVWVAVFWMRQEEGDGWKVDGCELLETTSVSI